MMFSPPGKLDITLTYNSPECSIGQNSTAHAYASPFKVTYDGKRLEENASFYEVLFSKVFLENKQAILDVKRDCVGVMRAPQASLSSAIGLYDLKTPIQWAFGDVAGPCLKPVGPLPVAVWVERCETVNVSYQCWPFRQMALFAIQMTGRSTVIIMTFADVEKVGDVATFIQQADTCELQTFPSYTLDEGDCVWCPPGSIPIVCGLPIAVKISADGVDVKGAPKDNQWTSHALAVVPIFDSELVCEICSTECRAAMAASWTRTRSWIPKVWLDNKDVQKFRAQLAPDAPGMDADADVK